MTHVLLYWNHICVLHKGEKQFLDKLTRTLREEEIDLEIRYFGLGYPAHMSEYLAQPDAELPDVIVSADLEVFEDPRIYGKFCDQLYPASGWISLREGSALEPVKRDDKLLPFVSIPLVYYTREPDRCAQTALPDWKGLAFGGINNSAVKTVVKAVWECWGKPAAGQLLENSDISDMPIGGFQAVRTGRAKTALVPSIYALRADHQETFLRVPAEGPVLIPSYFCARRSVPERVAKRIAEAILCPELCRFYAEQGDLIVYPAHSDLDSRQKSDRYVVPSAQWLSSLAPEEFYALYCRHLASAQDPFAIQQR